MTTRRRTLAAVAAFTTTWTLAGCITISPVVPSTTAKPGATASAKPGVVPKAKPDPAAKPKAGDAATLAKLKASGRVQVSFKGLGGPSRRSLKQTTADIARVEVTLTAANGFTQTRSLTRDQMMGPVASLWFDGVPVGDATLAVKAYDLADAPIGAGEESVEVVGGKTTELGMAVKLGATGTVGATIAFEDADIEETNISGYWFVGGEGSPPEYPMVGCGGGYIWYVTQWGDSVRASVSGYNEPGAADHPGMWWSEEAYGSMHEGVVRLHGRVTYTDEYGNMAAPPEEAEYELNFDTNRWQMAGTRNGKPGWASPYYFDPSCSGATPPPFPMYPPTPMPMPMPVGSWSPGPYPYPYPSGGTIADNPRITIEGTLHDAEGEPQAGVVWVSSYDDNVEFEVEVKTDAKGRYRVENVPTGIELELWAEVGDEYAQAWQVFYGFDAVESYDLWTSDSDWEDEGDDEDDAEADCTPRTWPTTGADGKTFMFSTCEPRPSCLPTYYPTTGPNGSTIMVQDCRPADVTYTSPSPYGSLSPSWSPAGTPPPTWSPTTAPSTR